MKLANTTFKWTGMVIAVMALIIVPFLLFGPQIEEWTNTFLKTASDHKILTAVVLSGLLATDIFLPIPSSIVSSAAGLFLGFIPGTLASLLGMTISCLAGYGLGRVCGQSFASRMLGKNEIEKLHRLSQRLGAWVIVITRPVPVLAEATVFFVGMGRMNFTRFMVMSTLANLAVSLVYAAIGAYSATANSFLLALGGSICLPGLMMLLFRKKKTEDIQS